MIDTVPSLTTRDLCDLGEVTYRQIDYWCRQNLLTPSVCDTRGSGHARQFTVEDALAVRLIRVLVSNQVDHDLIRQAQTLDLTRPFLWVQGDVVGVGSDWDLLEALAHVRATVVVNLSTLRAGLL